MAKPSVRLRSNPYLVIGEPHTFEIEVTAETDTRVDFIEGTIEGRQGWVIGSGKSRVSNELNYPKLVFDLMGPGMLTAGSTQRFTVRTALPADMPPSHSLGPAYAKLEMKVRISIPWRIDPRYLFSLRAYLPAARDGRPTPLSLRGAAKTPDKPRIDISVASTRVVAGSVLVGSLAIFHFDDKKPRDIKLSIVPELQLRSGRVRTQTATPYNTILTIQPGAAGTSVPFRLQIPASAVASLECVTHNVAWWLVARTGSLFTARADIAVPLEVLDPSAAPVITQLTVAPHLADEKTAEVFTRVSAATGWRAATPQHPNPRLAGDLAMERALDAGTVLRIVYAYRGEHGTYLVSAIDHIALGLGLAITPTSPLRDMFRSDIEVEIPAWDKAHHVTARAAEQARPFLLAVVPSLVDSSLGALVRWDDDALVFEEPIVALAAEDLEQHVRELERIAASLAAGMPQIGPPPHVTVDLAAWSDLAGIFNAKVTAGDLSMSGRDLHVAIEWDETRPRRLHAHVGDPEHTSDAARQVTLALARPRYEATDAAHAVDMEEAREVGKAIFPADSTHSETQRFREQIALLPSDAVDLQIAQGVVSAALPIVDDKLDPARVRSLVDALRAIHAALDPGRGPYR